MPLECNSHVFYYSATDEACRMYLFESLFAYVRTEHDQQLIYVSTTRCTTMVYASMCPTPYGTSCLHHRIKILNYRGHASSTV